MQRNRKELDLWVYNTLPGYDDDDDDLERLLDQARACERQHDADRFDEVRANVKIYVLKGNVPQLEDIVKWTEIRLSNHLDAIDSIGKAHDRFVVGDRCGFNEARAKVKRTVSSIEKN